MKSANQHHNFNLVELGPRGTGKSYAYQELSPYTILLTGPTTVANLFFNMATGKMGLVGIWDAIGFDEVADLQKMPKEVVTTLKTSVLAGLVILGDLSIQGNIKSVRSLSEPLQVAMDNGARRALIPLENRRNFLEVSGDIVERVDPIFFSDPITAAMKALGMT
jgi:predicted ATP-dependent Lon-type protease